MLKKAKKGSENANTTEAWGGEEEKIRHEIFVYNAKFEIL